MSRQVPHGMSSLYLASGVTFLNAPDSVFDAMIEGWRMQQIGGRRLKEESVAAGVGVVRRFEAYAMKKPWQWSASDFDEWMMLLVSQRQVAASTIRSYQGAVRQFCDYVCSPHYGWVDECMQRFGTHPVQVCHEWNTLPHLQDYEGGPGRRPLTRVELQRLLDHADDEVSRVLDGHRKGALPAFRDATLLKVVYAWGLRASEAVGLDVTDFYRNAKAPQFGEFGVLQVRHGKSSRGGPPKRRAVVSLFKWAVEALQEYVEQVRPLMVRSDDTTALWVSERGTRLRTRELASRFAAYRDALGLDEVLTPHALRHSYVTHLIESGVDPGFVQRQVGHLHQSTTAIYTGVSTDYMNTMMSQALERTRLRPSNEEGAGP
ncbi:tyrosine-type recombinase/integrase [Microbacterium sp. NPDC077184]|uniref:tyrosine-type recombinase/integrase n=2 Tax=Actinomycetes TaxID=1760 RepID=UPI00342BC5EA